MTVAMADKAHPVETLPVALVVDDSPVQLRLVGDVLGRNGYSVKTVPSAEAALQALATVLPVVIISDVVMSGMSGLELCQKVRSDAKFKHIPVILLTGETQPRDFKAGSDAGAVMYVAKPFQPEKLLNAVRLVCSLHPKNA